MLEEADRGSWWMSRAEPGRRPGDAAETGAALEEEWAVVRRNLMVDDDLIREFTGYAAEGQLKSEEAEAFSALTIAVHDGTLTPADRWKYFSVAQTVRQRLEARGRRREEAQRSPASAPPAPPPASLSASLCTFDFAAIVAARGVPPPLPPAVAAVYAKRRQRMLEAQARCALRHPTTRGARDAD